MSKPPSAPTLRVVPNEGGPDLLSGFLKDEKTDQITEEVNPALRDLREPVSEDTLMVLSGPQTGLVRPLDGDELVIGRGGGCDFSLEDGGVSRRHCRIRRGDGESIIEDLGSSNGTFVDGQAVTGPRPIRDGTYIHLGRYTILRVIRQGELQQSATRLLYDSSFRDPLTGIHNRRYLDQRLRQEIAFVGRHHTPLTLALCDLDHFKRVNDTWGHQAGDVVLKHVASVFERSLRKEDVVARYGGEEFAVVARGIGVEGARGLVERLRRCIEQTPARFEEKLLPLTASLGVVTTEAGRGFETVDALVEAADRALYRAKQAGRNRCEAA